MQSSEKINLSVIIQPKPESLQRITEFEGLRAILAWWVVGAHLLQYCGIKIRAPHSLLTWMVSAGYAVDLFVILSGFVIFLVLDITSKKNYVQFMTERFFRIYPLYITAFVAAILLMPIKIAVFREGGWHRAEFAQRMLEHLRDSYDYFFSNIVSHAFLIQGLLPDQEIPNSSTAFLGPAWNLSLEWQFYLVAPFLIFCLRRSIPTFLLTVGIIIGTQTLLDELSFGYGAFLPLKMDFFLIGILSYYFYKFSQISSKTASKIFPIALAFTLLLSILLFFSPDMLLAKRSIPLVIWVITFGTVIASSIKFRFLPLNLLSNFFNNPALQNLGKVSYSTYLAHQLIFWILMWLVMKAYPDVNKVSMFMILASIGEISVAIASFKLYEWLEKPFIKLGKQVSKSLASS